MAKIVPDSILNSHLLYLCETLGSTDHKILDISLYGTVLVL